MKSLFKAEYIIDNRFLDNLAAKSGFKLFLILLNRPIHHGILTDFAQYADQIISADGAGNRLFSKAILNPQTK